MANTATLTGKVGPGVSVSAVVLNNVRGYTVDFSGYVCVVTKENGSTEAIDLGNATVTLTTAVSRATGINSLTVSVA